MNIVNWAVLAHAFVAAPGMAQGVAPRIADTVLVDGAGTRLFLELQGRADAGPVLLHLHGGPGNAAALVIFRAYVGPAFEAEALVGYLHQRGVGRSAPVADSTLTIANHVADVGLVDNYLARRFPGRPIVLVGHSWGGLLAVLVALDRPANVAGIVNAAGPFDPTALVRESYQRTLAWAREHRMSEALADLGRIGPPPYPEFERQVTLSRWATTGAGGMGGRFDPAVAFGRPPYLAPDPSWTERQLAVSKAMMAEMYRTSVVERLPKARVPLLALAGRRDLIAPPSAIRAGMERYGGPKRYVELDDSHHLPFVDQPKRFVSEVMAFAKALK